MGEGGGKNMRLALVLGATRTLRAVVSEGDETVVCRYAETSLRLAYRGARPTVTPALDAVGVRGVLDVRLEWPETHEPPIDVRVVVHDEIARGAWREVSNAIGDAVRAALRQRCPAHPHPHLDDE